MSTLRVVRLRGLVVAVLLAVVAACVTINVYFPAAEAERAADRLIDEVWGEPAQGVPGAPAEQGPSGAQPGSGPSSRLDPPASAPLHDARWRLTARLLDLLLPAARAQANFDISTPAIEKLKQSMQARHARLSPHYDHGAIGLTEDGLITERDRKAIPLQERQEVIALIAAENRDRKALYAEIARANGHPEWESQVQSTFAARWISKARPGWWYLAQGTWRQR